MQQILFQQICFKSHRGSGHQEELEDAQRLARGYQPAFQAVENITAVAFVTWPWVKKMPTLGDHRF